MRFDKPIVSLFLGCVLGVVSMINVYKFALRRDAWSAVFSAVAALAAGAIIAVAAARLKGKE